MVHLAVAVAAVVVVVEAVLVHLVQRQPSKAAPLLVHRTAQLVVVAPREVVVPPVVAVLQEAEAHPEAVVLREVVAPREVEAVAVVLREVLREGVDAVLPEAVVRHVVLLVGPHQPTIPSASKAYELESLSPFSGGDPAPS